MSDNKKSTIKVSVGDSYTPKKVERSYQPTPTPKPKPGASYTPTSEGHEPTSRPTPPGKE